MTTNKFIESLRGDLAALHDAGAIDKVTIREFDAICSPPVRKFNAEQGPASHSLILTGYRSGTALRVFHDTVSIQVI